MSESVQRFTEKKVKDLPDTLFINNKIFKKYAPWTPQLNRVKNANVDCPGMVKIDYLDQQSSNPLTMTYCEDGDVSRPITNQELGGKNLSDIIKEKRVYQDDSVTNTPETIVLGIAGKEHCFYKVMAEGPIEQPGVTFLQKGKNEGWDFFFYHDKEGKALTWDQVKNSNINLYAIYSYKTERIDENCGTTIKHNGKKYTLVAHDNQEEFTKHHDHAKGQYVKTKFCCYKGDYKCIAFMEDGKYVTDNFLFAELLDLCSVKSLTQSDSYSHAATRIPQNVTKERSKKNETESYHISTHTNNQNKQRNLNNTMPNIVKFGQTVLPHQAPNTNVKNYLFANSNCQSQQPKVYPIFFPTVPQCGKYPQNQKILQQAIPVQQVPAPKVQTVPAGPVQAPTVVPIVPAPVARPPVPVMPVQVPVTVPAPVVPVPVPNVVQPVPVTVQKCYLRNRYYGPCQNTLYNMSNGDKIYGCGQVYPGNFTEYMFSNRPIYKCPDGGFITTGKAKYSLTGNPLEYYR